MRQPMQSAAVSFCRDIFENLTNIFLRLEAGHHNLVAAAKTFEPKIRTDSQYPPPLFTAGMGLFHH